MPSMAMPFCVHCAYVVYATNVLFKQYFRHYSLCMPRMPRVCHLCALYGVCVYSMLSMTVICPLLSLPGLVSCPHYASLPICASSMSSLTSVMPFTYTIYVIYALYALFMFCLSLLSIYAECMPRLCLLCAPCVYSMLSMTMICPLSPLVFFHALNMIICPSLSL